MKHPIRWLLVFVAVLVLLVAALFVLRHRQADGIFDESDQRVTKLVATYRRGGGPRPPVGEPNAGVDARGIYDAALARFGFLAARDREIEDWLLGERGYQKEPTEAEVEAFFAATGTLLEAVKPALAAPVLGAGNLYELSSDDIGQRIPGWQSFARVADAHIARHLDRGDVDDAVDLAVMETFVGLDVARHAGLLPHLVGLGIARVGTNNLHTILADHPVRADRLERLAAEAEVLRAGIPPARDAWRAEEIYIRLTLRDPRVLESELVDVSVGWRYLFSNRLLAADALQQLSGQREAFEAAVAGKSGKAAAAAASRRVHALEDDPNPLLRMIFLVYPVSIRVNEEMALQLELLRTAVAVARHRAAQGTWPESLAHLVPVWLPALPVCPFSEALLLQRDGKVWSIGGDGDDDGGIPLGEDDDMEDDGDVVWTLHEGDPK